MLQTQVAYWANKENARHNIVTESQTDRDLKRKQAELDQTIRYQTEQVRYWEGQLAELTRHNKATENLSEQELEVKREHAKAALDQAQAALQNAETNRKDLANKSKHAEAALQQASASKEQAAASTRRAATEAKESGTRMRSNLATSVKTEVDTELQRRRVEAHPWTDIILPAVKTVLPW